MGRKLCLALLMKPQRIKKSQQMTLSWEVRRHPRRLTTKLSRAATSRSNLKSW
jgi:hypothetical protein